MNENERCGQCDLYRQFDALRSDLAELVIRAGNSQLEFLEATVKAIHPTGERQTVVADGRLPWKVTSDIDFDQIKDADNRVVASSPVRSGREGPMQGAVALVNASGSDMPVAERERLVRVAIHTG